jgi:hypothetical protein
MSAEAMGWVFRHSPVKGTMFTVHLAIADVVNDQNDNEFWMSQTNLAQKARCSDRHARRALDALMEAGLVTLLEDNSKAGKPNRYRFEVGHCDAPGRTQCPTPVGRGVLQTQRTTQENSNTRAAASFDAFWEAYPRKTAKGAARVAYGKAAKKEAENVLLDAVNHFARASRGVELRFIPHAATWLNQERWLDDLEPVSTFEDIHPREI